MDRSISLLLPVLPVLAVCACTPLGQAQRIAAGRGLEPRLIAANDFVLQAYFRPAQSLLEREVLNVYIEGDGRAWLAIDEPSDDPTPTNPIGLRLAAADTSGAATLYLARPCQYAGRDSTACEVSVWTDSRFSEAVVEAVDLAIDAVARDLDVEVVNLVGYSGGGVIAALVAARRPDVGGFVTIATPLDHAAWTLHHGVSRLDGSLNPPDFSPRLKEIRQLHFVGGEDDVVPRSVVDSYLSKLDDNSPTVVVDVPGFDHGCCWAEQWPQLSARVPWL